MKKLRISLFIVLALVLVLSLLLSACAKPAPAPAPAPAPTAAPTAAPAPAPPVEPVILKFTYHEPPPPPAPAKASATVQMHYWLGEQIEKRTNGRVKFEYFGGAVLGKPFDFDALIGGDGGADIGLMTGGYFTWKLPVWAAAGLPFLTPDPVVASKGLWQLYQEWAPMQQEWEGFNLKPLVFFNAASPETLLLREPITKLEDLKGLKLAGAGRQAPFIESVGAVHVAIPIGEVYDSFSKGLLDGVIAPHFIPKHFKWTEVAKYLLPLDFLGYPAVSAVAINIDVWNKLPQQDQQVIEEVFAEYLDAYSKKAAEEGATLDGFYQQQGMTFIYVSADEAASFKAKNIEAMQAGWIATAKEKGVPIDEFLDRYQAEMQQFLK